MSAKRCRPQLFLKPQTYLLSKPVKDTAPAGLLTSERSSSGWINLLVALEVVRVAGLLVRVEGGLETVLLPAVGLATAAAAWV